MTSRRIVLAAAIGSLLVQPVRATPEALAAAVLAFTDGRPPRDDRVTLDIATLIDNGNVVPVSVTVQSPMSSDDHVRRIGLFTELNPQPEVAVFHLGPRSGRAFVATRMRLATSQTITALALMNDGSVWRHRVEVIVTLAACLEG